MKYLLINKRYRWVAFLNQKKEHRKIKVFSDVEKRKLRTVKHTQDEVREQIAATINTPNKSWAKRRKHKKYALSRSFFGQYAWLRLIIRYAVVWYSMTLDVQQRYSHFYFVDFQTSFIQILTFLIFLQKNDVIFWVYTSTCRNQYVYWDKYKKIDAIP